MELNINYQPIKYQRGEINVALATAIAGVVIALGALLYANQVSQHAAAQQALIEQLQTTVATQQEQFSQSGTELSELQSSSNLLAARLDTLEKEVHLMKEEARKRAEQAKAAAKKTSKPPVKPTTKKPAGKTTKKK